MLARKSVTTPADSPAGTGNPSSGLPSTEQSDIDEGSDDEAAMQVDIPEPTESDLERKRKSTEGKEEKLQARNKEAKKQRKLSKADRKESKKDRRQKKEEVRKARKVK
jgi:exosome complex protein LRP1